MIIRTSFYLLLSALLVFASLANPLQAQDLFDFPEATEKQEQDPPEPDNGMDDAPDPNAEKSDQENDPLLDGDLVVRPEEEERKTSRFQLPPDAPEKPGQSVVLKSKFAGWEQAGPGLGGRRLSKDLRANWVMVDPNGRFSGQVVAGKGADIDGMVVSLMHMGRHVKDTRLNKDGTFEFFNVAEGPYSLVGWSAKGFFAFGFIALDHNATNAPKAPSTIKVTAFQNQSSINLDWIRHFAPKANYRIYGRYVEGEGPDDPVSLYGISGLSQNLPEAAPATSIDSKSVVRTTSGGLLGRVHQMNSSSGRPVDVRNTRVMLLQEDNVVVATDTDNYGVFYFPKVELGEYGLLAAGVDGVGLVGITVSDQGNAPSVTNELGELKSPDLDKAVSKPVGTQEPYPFDFCMVSTETIGWMNHYASELAYRRNLLAPRAPNPYDQKQTCPGCDGMGCNNCQGSGLCTSRSQSFEDWAANCANQHQKTKLGSGYILSEASKDLRRGVQKSNSYFENAFYGSSGGGYGAQNGMGNQNGAGYQNGYGDQNGYQNGSGNMMNGPSQGGTDNFAPAYAPGSVPTPAMGTSSRVPTPALNPQR